MTLIESQLLNINTVDEDIVPDNVSVVALVVADFIVVSIGDDVVDVIIVVISTAAIMLHAILFLMTRSASYWRLQ